LAGEDHNEGESTALDDGGLDGEGDLALVGAEVDATGGGPTDGVEADGVADFQCERGEG
jgi:hypothetical protein